MPDLWNSTTHISFPLYDKNIKHEIVVGSQINWTILLKIFALHYLKVNNKNVDEFPGKTIMHDAS